MDKWSCPNCGRNNMIVDKTCTWFSCQGLDIKRPDDKPKGRYFEGGAYRDVDDNKLDYARALSPEVLERYLTFLQSNRLQSDGNLRDFDNWKSGMPVDVCMSSLWRHVMSVWKYVYGRFAKQPTESLEDALCAVIFNAMVMLHEVMREDNE